jgi:hypothetical protein
VRASTRACDRSGQLMTNACDVSMLQRMQKERITISLDAGVAARVRQCGATSRGGVSGYLERLIRQDELREGVDAMARWYARHPGYADDAEAERAAVADELGDTA